MSGEGVREDDITVSLVASGGGGGGGGAGGAGGAAESKIATVEKSSTASLKLYTGTWNVGNKAPPAGDDLAPWLPKGGGGYDLIVISVQEAKYKAKKGEDEEEVKAEPSTKSKFAFWDVVTNHLGPAYQVIAEVVQLEMGLIVLATEATAARITDVVTAKEATGLLSVVGNKGGCIVQFCMGGTSMCFIGSHLAAHLKEFEKRNENVVEILSETRLAEKSIDIDTQFSHCFWIGDLNYRLDHAITEGESGAALTVPERWEKVQAMIKAKNWKGLMAMDQLKDQQKKGKAFVGFVEGDYNFAPTFKTLREDELKYTTQRVSSYCDRVLWKSLPGLAKNVKQRTLEAHLKPGTSDHKAVSSTFSIAMREDIPVRPVDDKEKLPLISITKLKGRGLAVADVRSSDPYIEFLTDPMGLILKDSDGRNQRTHWQSSTINPSWKDDEVPRMRVNVASKAELAGVHLFFKVMDADAGMNPDDPMGQAVLSLAPASAVSGPVPFKLTVTMNGQAKGTVSGEIEVLWPSDDAPIKDDGVKKQKGCCIVM